MTQRHRIAWGLGSLTLILLLGWVATVGLSRWRAETALAAIQQRGVLRVGLDASFPPFEFLDAEGQVIGLDADLARVIAADLGVTVEFVNIGFDGLYDALLIGRVDVLISGLPVDPLRRENVAYSYNYFNAGQVLLSDDPTVRGVEDLAGRSVAVEWGSMAELEVRRLQDQVPNLRIDARNDPAAALDTGLAVADGVVALSRPDLQRVTYLSDEWYAIAVDVENRALLTAINQSLSRVLAAEDAPCSLQLPNISPDYPDKPLVCYANRP